MNLILLVYSSLYLSNISNSVDCAARVWGFILGLWRFNLATPKRLVKYRE